MAGIDTDFWLEYAKESVSKNIESRVKSAEELDKFLFWTWGIYTAIFASASIFNFVGSNAWQLFWMAQPVVVIMLSRLLCSVVSMPIIGDDEEAKADPNNVASIIDSYSHEVEDKSKKLKLAKIFTFISVVSIAAAITGYNYCDPDKKMKADLQKEKLRNELYDVQIKNIVNDKLLEYSKSGNPEILKAIKEIKEIKK
jgi:hypothetical protein